MLEAAQPAQLLQRPCSYMPVMMLTVFTFSDNQNTDRHPRGDVNADIRQEDYLHGKEKKTRWRHCT